jgi:hypothetical protein
LETNVNWLIVLAVVAGVLLVALALISLGGRRAARRLENERKRSIDQAEEIRGALAALQTQVDEMKQPVPQPEPAAPLRFVPAPTLTADQRAEALGMLRRGMASHSVSTTLRLPRAEMALLQKVDSLLTSSAK